MNEWLFPVSALTVVALTIPISWLLWRWDAKIIGRAIRGADINALVQDCVKLTAVLRSDSKEINETYKVRMDLASVPLIDVVPAKLRGALKTVLDNTISATPVGGTIEIATGYDAEHVFISVGELRGATNKRDDDFRFSAAGLDSEHTLSGVYEIVRGHGGEIEYNPGSGRRFVIRLPATHRRRNVTLNPSIP